MTAKLGEGGGWGEARTSQRAREGQGGQEEGRCVGAGGAGGGGERRNFPVRLTLAQAALGLHKGGPLSSQLCWCP